CIPRQKALRRNVGRRQHRREYVDALSGIGGVQCDVERRTCCIRPGGALVESNRNVGIAQQAGGDAPICEVTQQPPRQRQNNIFLRQRRGDGRSNVVAAVCGIDQHQEAWRGGLPRLRRWVLRIGRSRRGGRRLLGNPGDRESVV